jgi:hypothetical protein
MGIEFKKKQAVEKGSSALLRSIASLQSRLRFRLRFSSASTLASAFRGLPRALHLGSF